MWRQCLYVVCTVEVALLAVALYVLVVEPAYALSPTTSQLCAVAALVLAGGCCYAVARQVLIVIISVRWLHR